MQAAAQGREARFGGRIDRGLVQNPKIREASGIAASRKNPGILWVHNDSDQEYIIYAMNERGRHLGTIQVGFRQPRDYEDMAVGPGPKAGEWYIYLGDIGDNQSRYKVKEIYRFPEPDISKITQPFDIRITEMSVITYRYPDGKRDAETLLVDPQTRDIFIISKKEDSVRVYKAAYPQPLDSDITLATICALPLSMVTGGDISLSGEEILIKTYFSVYYWKRHVNESWEDAFRKSPLVLPYLMEPQGEAICWAKDAKGYFTVSEEKGGIPARLYFYPRVK